MNEVASPYAGWYPDPYDAERLRWWDGQIWTERQWPAAVVVPRREPTVLERWWFGHRAGVAFGLLALAALSLLTHEYRDLMVVLGVLASITFETDSKRDRVIFGAAYFAVFGTYLVLDGGWAHAAGILVPIALAVGAWLVIEDWPTPRRTVAVVVVALGLIAAFTAAVVLL